MVIVDMDKNNSIMIIIGTLRKMLVNKPHIVIVLFNLNKLKIVKNRVEDKIILYPVIYFVGINRTCPMLITVDFNSFNFMISLYLFSVPNCFLAILDNVSPDLTIYSL